MSLDTRSPSSSQATTEAPVQTPPHEPTTASEPWSRGRNQVLYTKAKAALEAPMMVLSLVLGGLLVAPLIWELSPGTIEGLEAASWVIWALFVAEYALLWWLAPDRKAMMRSHLLELALILLPMLRPLRALRVLRLARAVVGLAGAVRLARRILERRGLQWFLLSVFGVVLAGAGLTWAFEHNHPDSSIQSFPDALWWAVVTCTTVGYGDLAPVTPAGRGVAVVLMIVGVGLLSTLTANVASVFVQQDARSEGDAGALTHDVVGHCPNCETLLVETPLAATTDSDRVAPDGPTLEANLADELVLLHAKVDQLMAALNPTAPTAIDGDFRTASSRRRPAMVEPVVSQCR